MKKYAVILPLGLLLWASCEQNSVSDSIHPENQVVEVTFNLTLRQDVAEFRSTRGLPGGLPDEPISKNNEDAGGAEEEEGEETQPTVTLSYVDYAIYDAEGTYIRHERKEISVKPDGSASFSLQEAFTAGVYKICFLAHNVEGAQFSEEDNLVTFPTVSDTFWGNDEFEIDASLTNQEIPVSIRRAIAGVEFRPTDHVPEQIHHFNIESSGLYNTINLLDGIASDATTELNYSYIFKEEDREKLVSQTFYTFVPEKLPESDAACIDAVTISALTEEDGIERTRTIADIPIYRNKITRYTGTLYTPSIVDGELTVEIETEWDGYIDKELDSEE